MSRISDDRIPIDRYAYVSNLRKWNASCKAILAVGALVTTLAAGNLWISLMTIVFMGTLSVAGGGVRLRDYLRLMMIPALFLALGTIAILIQFGSGSGETLARLRFFSGYLYITKAGLTQSLNLVCKAFGAFSALFLLTLSTPMGEIITILRKLRLPGILVELTRLIYRYIFILIEQNGRQKEASASRLGYKDWKTSLRTFGGEMANLFVVSMKKAESYYDAMEARGYDGGCLFWEEERPVTPAPIFCAALYAAMAVSLIILRNHGFAGGILG